MEAEAQQDEDPAELEDLATPLCASSARSSGLRCCRAREARDADREAAASDLGSVELRGWDLLAARRGSVRGGWCGSCCCAAVWMTGDSA